jgi:F-type H+-transporting ATPase subunit a
LTAAAQATAADRTQAVQHWVLHHSANQPEWMLTPSIGVPMPPGLGVHGVMMLVAAAGLILLFALARRGAGPVPRGLANALEAMVLFVRDRICAPHLGSEEGRRLTPFFCTHFFFILGMNLMGLVPIFPTPTGNVNVTAAMAATTLGLMIGLPLWRKGPAGFVRCFVPHGVPWALRPMLVVLELAGPFVKTFALTIRLFANMLAGHIVLFSLAGLVFAFGLAAVPALVLALLIYALEVLVAFLQAYVFTLLSAMFVGQLLQSEH